MESDKVRHIFKPGSNFENAMDLYRFDCGLRELIFTAIQAVEMAQWKSTVDVFLFHSILYLCIMNMLEQLARIVLPKEILDNFDIV